MKKLVNFVAIFLTVFSVQSCNYLDSVGFGNPGQPIKQVNDNLIFSKDNFIEKVDHTQWDRLLKKYVSKEGLVNYKGFLKDRKALNNYLQMLAENPPSENWSVQELLAYYINLYNAATVNLILDNYPLKSIKDINGPWRKKIVPIGNDQLSLGEIEHSILRKMNEPRIHFAINCASFSCPNLLNEAFTASKIEAQLERATKTFINSDKNELSKNQVKFSAIFDWFKKDFKLNGKVNVIGYINQYSSTKINLDAKINYKDYDWNLNEALND